MEGDGPAPRFADSVTGQQAGSDGEFAMRWDVQCPFNLHWSGEVIESLRSRGHSVSSEQITGCAGAQSSPSPLGTYSLSRGTGLASHHLTGDKATERMLGKL